MNEPSSGLPDSYQGEDLIFIVGSPRSGTTWLQRLMASHPMVMTGQESDLFDLYLGPQLRSWNTYKTQTGRGILGLACHMTEEQFLSCLKAYALSLLAVMFHGKPREQLFVEKTPSHALFIPEIVTLLPRARFIHMLRDPRDVAISMMRVSKTWGGDWAPANARDAGIMWRDHVLAAEKALADLEPGQFMRVRYEDMLSDPKGQLGNVFTFAGLTVGGEELGRFVQANVRERARANQGTHLPLRGQALESGGVPHVVEPEDFVAEKSEESCRHELGPERLQALREAVEPTAGAMGYTLTA